MKINLLDVASFDGGHPIAQYDHLWPKRRFTGMKKRAAAASGQSLGIKMFTILGATQRFFPLRPPL